MARFLVIEDEPNLRVFLSRLLGGPGHIVTTAATGADGLALASAQPFDLILLDLMLPDLPGETVMRRLLARRPDAKILVLSSAPEAARRIGVLQRGATDFMSKPFVNGELLARVRSRLAEAAPPPGTGGQLAIDRDAYLDTVRSELVLNDQRISLSQRECTLLSHLVQRRGGVCTRAELLADVWGLGFDPGTNVVDVYIGRLRAKLAPLKIETVRKVGYRLAAS